MASHLDCTVRGLTHTKGVAEMNAKPSKAQHRAVHADLASSVFAVKDPDPAVQHGFARHEGGTWHSLSIRPTMQSPALFCICIFGPTYLWMVTNDSSE
jgi:hypothetical protein